MCSRLCLFVTRKKMENTKKERGERKRGMKRKAVLTYDARRLCARTAQ